MITFTEAMGKMEMKTFGKTLKRTALLAAILGILGTFLGCSTVQGVGKDVQRIGEGIQEPFN